MTARTLGLDEKYDIVFRVLAEISETSGDALNFEEFLKALTARIVPIFVYFRELHSLNKEEELTSVCMTSKEKESSQLMNSNTSMTNSSMDSMMINFGKSFMQLEVTTPNQSLLKSSTNIFKRNFQIEKLPFDFALLCILV